MPTKFLLAGLFFLSGLSALGYQVVWQRVLTQEIGVDSISIAFIVAIFLLGIGAGSYSHRFIAHLSLREKRNVYIIIEIVIALFGIFSIPLLRTANQAAFWGNSIGGQFVLNMLILLAPTVFMGLTTPLILDLVKAKDENIGRTIGLFYGVNILGAAIGAMITGLALIELFGLNGVAMLCASINFVLALGVGLTLRDIDGPGIMRPTVRLCEKQWGYLLVAVFFGFGAMALQMAYYRTAFNHFQLYTFIFPFMLGVFLLAMAVGQFVFGQIADRVKNRSLVIAVSIFIFSLVLLIIYRVPLDFFQPCQYEDYPRLFIRFAAIFMVPVAIASGMFTLLTRYTTAQAANAGYQFGLMMAAVSLGNVLGALIGPLFLFTLIGTMGVLSLAIVLYTLGVLIMYIVLLQRKLSYMLTVMTAALLVAFFPQNYFAQNKFFFGSQPVSYNIEDELGIVSVFKQADRAHIQMFRSPTAVAYTHELAGFRMLPLSELYKGRAARMLIIGLGGANYLPLLVQNPRIDEIVIVELSPAVLHEVYKNGTHEIRAAMDTPKVKIVNADGRRFVLQALRNGEKYDIVQTGIFYPWTSGSGNLYTQEYVRAIRGLLNPGGIYVTLELELIALTAGSVFKYAYSRPADNYVYFVAADQPREIPGLCLREFSGNPDLLNTDNRPIVEYWMLSIWRDGFMAALEAQQQHYQAPCPGP